MVIEFSSFIVTVQRALGIYAIGAAHDIEMGKPEQDQDRDLEGNSFYDGGD
jgi:hypothetical protein